VTGAGAVSKESPTLFCFGLGYCAARLARSLAAEGWSILGTSRAADAVERLRAEGFVAQHFARGVPLGDVPALLARATHVLVSIPPDDHGDPVLDLCGEHLRGRAGLAGGGAPADNQLRGRAGLAGGGAPAEMKWLGYLSTTGVYGDRSGAMVDETAPLAPTGERGQRRVAAEAGWRTLWHEHDLPVHVFRLAGIYGPGRNSLDALREGSARRIRKPGHVFSRIHVDDVVQVLRASIARPEPGAVYNVADDHPAPSEDVVAYAAELLGVPAPAPVDFAAAELSAMARSFYADNKRVSNRLIKERLGVTLRYPSYRDGLKALSMQVKAPPPRSSA
jgi:nucleoside-diphosphate-sugar epimerase